MLHVIAYLFAGAGFLLLAGVVAVGGSRNKQSWGLAFAALLHALWAFSAVIHAVPLSAVRFLETAHVLGWVGFFGILLTQGRSPIRPLVIGVCAVLLTARTAEIAWNWQASAVLQAQISLSIDLLAVSVALALVVAVFRAAGDSDRWSLKFLCFPLAALFGYDLFLLAQSLGAGLLPGEYHQVRGVLNAMAAPLVFFAAIRRRSWQETFEMSRQAALYSAALIAIGGYLLLLGAVSMVMARLGPEGAPPLQVVFLFGAVLLLLFLLYSGGARARIKLFLSRHVYARKYDYQHEWRKFMGTLTQEGASNPLENRIIRACADLLEVPGGALWLMEGSRPRLEATWNHRPGGSVMEDFDPAEFEGPGGGLRILHGQSLAESSFLRIDAGAWCAIPLPHGNDPIGFIALSEPRAPNRLDAEDEELLLLVARQCASHLAERQAVRELEENRQFSRFNRQFAFVAHDVKNIVSQLSLMLKNFEKYADNPEFQKDMRETVAHSVERMRNLLGRLNSVRQQEDESGDQRASIEVRGLLVREAQTARREEGPDVQVSVAAGAGHASARLPRERFASVIAHLLQNACEASGPEGTVTVYLEETAREILIEIADDGPGMSLDFIRDNLFAPFRSTKRDGFGVGVYQCREFAREQGGDLDVVSSPGSGTVMRLRLPRATAAGTAEAATVDDQSEPKQASA